MATIELASVARALLGGALIGFAAGLLFLVHGRICGISGILGGLVRVGRRARGDNGWRVAFIGGMVACAVVVTRQEPSVVTFDTPPAIVPLALSGLLVGFGARLGSGCTSGHGVCGISQLSRRSIAATAIFMAAGMVTASVWS